jgi:hypothetical protein
LLVVTISVFLLMVVLAALLRRPIETAADRTE